MSKTCEEGKGMAIPRQLKEYLEAQKVKYSLLQHPKAYTASEIAGKQHIPGKQFLKSVIVKADDEYMMCVLPATHLVDFDKLNSVVNAKELRLASEEELSSLFPDYELGAEPPFGQLKILADEHIEENSDIFFNGGTHTDIVQISYQEFQRLSKPNRQNFARHI